jgi:Single-strand binding protein family
MSGARVLVTGSISKTPEQRKSSTGRNYVFATIETTAADGISSDVWNVLAFGDTAGEELLRLQVGEWLSVQGVLKLDIFSAADGSKKIGRTIFADYVLALRAPPKLRKPREAAR